MQNENDLTRGEAEYIAAELEKEFDVPVHVTEAPKRGSIRMFARLAAEYANGKTSIKPKVLLNRAVAGEIVGGEGILELGTLLAKIAHRKKNSEERIFVQEMGERVAEIRQVMADEVCRRYSEPAGLPEVYRMVATLNELIHGGERLPDEIFKLANLIREELGHVAAEMEGG